MKDYVHPDNQNLKISSWPTSRKPWNDDARQRTLSPNVFHSCSRPGSETVNQQRQLEEAVAMRDTLISMTRTHIGNISGVSAPNIHPTPQHRHNKENKSDRNRDPRQVASVGRKRTHRFKRQPFTFRMQSCQVWCSGLKTRQVYIFILQRDVRRQSQRHSEQCPGAESAEEPYQL